jgi:hypothetical protein
MKVVIAIQDWNEGDSVKAYAYDDTKPNFAGTYKATFVSAGTVGNVTKFYADIATGFEGTVLVGGALLSPADAGIWIGPAGNEQINDGAVTPEKTSFIYG